MVCVGVVRLCARACRRVGRGKVEERQRRGEQSLREVSV